MFQKYESIPKIVEAVQFTEANKDVVFNSISGNCQADFEGGDPVMKITTIHGDEAIVRIGDWIVKEPKPGCYYPVTNAIFRKTYLPLAVTMAEESTLEMAV